VRTLREKTFRVSNFFSSPEKEVQYESSGHWPVPGSPTPEDMQWMKLQIEADFAVFRKPSV
jgi:hypothetical protein